MSAWVLPFLIVVLGVAFDVFCLIDVVRARELRYFPRWMWAVICVCFNPLGGVTYLAIGKSR